MAAQGTLESILIEFSRIFDPLNNDIESGSARYLLAEMLGLSPSEISKQQEDAFIAAFKLIFPKEGQNKLAELANLLQELFEDIANNDFTENLNTILEISSKINDLISDFSRLQGAFTSLSIDENLKAKLIDQLPERLLHYLIYRYVDKVPHLAPTFELIGIIQKEYADSERPYRNFVYRFNFDKLINWITNPVKAFETEFSWNSIEFSPYNLFKRIETFFHQLSIPVLLDTSEIPKLNLFFLELNPIEIRGNKGIEILLKNQALNHSTPFGSGDWEGNIALSIALESGTKFKFLPSEDLEIELPRPNADFTGNFLLEWKRKNKDNPVKPLLVLGSRDGQRFEIEELELRLKADFKWDIDSEKVKTKIELSGEIKKAKIVLNADKSDGFLSSVIPENTSLSFDVDLGYSSTTGFHFNGSSSLEVYISKQVDLAFGKLEGVKLKVGLNGSEIPILLGANIQLDFGPVTLTINDIGFETIFSFPNAGGNLGPLNLDLGFKAPTGLGIKIDGGGFTGAGALEFKPDLGQYSGFLFLDFKGICTLRTFGILNTKLPNGQPGYSFALIFAAGFTPELQIGMGFTINRVGGIIGLNRSMDTQPLLDGLKGGTLDRSLFLNDSELNGTQVINDLQRVFPVADSRFVFGPVARMGWGTPTLLTIDLALLIEVPDPVKMVVLGVVKTALPSVESAILKLNCSFIGKFDAERKQLYFYASVYDSRLLTFTLSGDMLFMLNWGEQSNFVLSVGGFHPKYKAPALPVPPLKRLTINLLAENNPRLTLETYFAVTSNSVQFGGRVELYVDAWIFSINGYVYLDTLFQFSPFFLSASVGGMLAVKLAGQTLFSITVAFTLEGPTPWHAYGTASFTVFIFITIDIGFDITWGESQRIIFETTNVSDELHRAFADPKNWKAILPPNVSQYVSVRDLVPVENTVIVHPMGTIEISQNKAPLHLEMNKFGNTKIAGESKFDIPRIQVGTNIYTPGENYSFIKEQFAAGQYVDLGKEEVFTHEAFEDFDAGIRLDISKKLRLSKTVRRKRMEHEVSYYGEGRGNETRQLDGDRFHRYLAHNATALSPVAKRVNPRIQYSSLDIQAETFVIADVDNLNPVSTERFNSSLEASQAQERLFAQQPGLRGKTQVISSHHLQAI